MNQTPEEFDAAVVDAERRGHVELAAAVAMLRARRRGTAAARAAGVTCALFDHDDLAAIFVVVDFTHLRPLIDTLIYARAILRRINRWDEATPRDSRGAFWSCARLAAAAVGDEELAAVSLPELFRELRRIDARWQKGRVA